MSDTYFRGLSRSRYEAFYRILTGTPIGQIRQLTISAFITEKLLVWDGTPLLHVPEQVRQEHNEWHRENFRPDGKRIRHPQKGGNAR